VRKYNKLNKDRYLKGIRDVRFEVLIPVTVTLDNWLLVQHSRRLEPANSPKIQPQSRPAGDYTDQHIIHWVQD